MSIGLIVAISAVATGMLLMLAATLVMLYSVLMRMSTLNVLDKRLDAIESYLHDIAEADNMTTTFVGNDAITADEAKNLLSNMLSNPNLTEEQKDSIREFMNQIEEESNDIKFGEDDDDEFNRGKF